MADVKSEEKKEGGDATPASKVDVVAKFIETRTQTSFRHIKDDKFKKCFGTESNATALQDFINTDGIRCLLFTGDSITATTIMPKMLGKGKSIYFLKRSDCSLSEKNVHDQVLIGELTSEPLAYLERLVQDIYMPLLDHPANQVGWGEVAAKDINEKMLALSANVSIVLGQTRGTTCLPLPPVNDGTGDGMGKVGSAKDRTHTLEGAIITWTRQIKGVLKMDPESALKQGLHPTPDHEVAFWRNKSDNLDTIFQQLKSPEIRKVLRMLDQSKSTYCTPFAKLCKEVFTSQQEANDNVRFLCTLEPWFDHLGDASQDFTQLPKLYEPTLHVLLLVWKNSLHYNKTARLVVLVREICNAVINQAGNFTSGGQLFELIEKEQAHVAVEHLKTIIKVCGQFKNVYFDYKTKALETCPENPWRVQNTALFMRMDSFIERCHDILDLAQTIVQFSRLAKIEIGGTKGKTLTNSVLQVHSEFEQAVATFRAVKYDIMDVNAKQFDDDFYDFRCRIKELERRLGSVLTTGFDDAPTITGRFKLLDLFDGLLERPIIQDELEKKHVALVQAYGSDLKVVQELFLVHRDDPPIANNLPPIAGSIGWCRGLMARIELPMVNLVALNDSIMEREEAKEVSKIYDNIMSSLQDFVTQKIAEWGKDVESSSQAKLKLPLLRRDQETRLLAVNFDKDLDALLREVKYFLLLDLAVPESGLKIFKQAEVFRQWTGNLALIVNIYNGMIQSLLPVEEPLVRTHFDKIDKTVARGIGQMNWKSNGIDFFIQESTTCVKSADLVLSTLKTNLGKAEEIMAEWARAPLLSRTSKPVSIQEFDSVHKVLLSQKYPEIKSGGSQIHALLKESNKVLKVSQGLPDWKAYVDFVNNTVVEGLARVVSLSLAFLSDQIDPEEIRRRDKMPMLEIDLTLLDTEVMFSPDLFETAKRDGVRDVVNGWIDSFFNTSTIFKRLDTNNGTYLKELRNNMTICAQLARIMEFAEGSEAEMIAFRQQYESYSYLWTTDLQKYFADFVADATLSTSDSGRPNLDLAKFEAAISKYRTVQVEINDLNTPSDITWLRANSQPIKQALGVWATKWMYLHTQHLVGHVESSLENLNSFMARVDEGLEEEVDVSGGKKEPLMRAMGHIRDVRKSMDETSDMIHPLRETVALLKKNGLLMTDVRIGGMDVNEYLEQAPLKWDALVNKTFKKKEEILPLQNKEVDNIKGEVDKFFLAMRDFRNGFRKNAPFESEGGITIEEVYSILDKYETDRMTKVKEAAKFNELEELFELPVTSYLEPKTTLQEMQLLKMVWDHRESVSSIYASWSAQPWMDIDTESLDDFNKGLLKTLRTFAGTNPMVKGWGAYKNLEQQVKDMSVVLPLINDLHSKSMQARHWKNISMVCHSKAIDPKDPKLSLETLLELQLHNHADDVSEIVETANKELKVDSKLRVIEQTWASLNLEFAQHKDTEMSVVKAPDLVVEALESHQLELQTMIGMGKFVDFFRDKVMHWQKTLGNVESVLKEWQSVSKAWASLESIFLASADIRAQLPEDTKRFEGIDAEFKELMGEAVETPNTVQACTREGREELLRGMTKNLELCQKSLNEYLDMKKKIFPRFYFVSNPSLLDILSNGNNPPKIMPYVSDCYDSISTLVFKDNGDGTTSSTEAVAMIAKDGERVEFPRDFVIGGAVENWLNDLTAMMQECLKHHMHTGIESALHWEVEKPRHVWLFDYIAQVILQVTTVYWTEESEAALEALEGGDEDAVRKTVEIQSARIDNLVQLVLGKLSKQDRRKIIALITLDVHARDCNQDLVDEKAEGPNSFAWLKQLRFYWQQENRDVLIRICDYNTLYSYEWVGNTGRLVITPLTDRCYITLTTALRLMLGGAPAGPAGTGKTETTKDLARALALPCYVFNCSDQMNFQGLGDIFKGLSQSGSWGCFDEFNRIHISVLSVVATQVKTIQDAIIRFAVPAQREEQYQDAPAGLPPVCVGTFEFMGDTIRLVPTTGYFITMNPGYAGRTELPENLKVLFRSCAMIRPDLRTIMENMLMSEGFMKARQLSVKFFELYSLSEALLSKQRHYDWGLRAVKSVLRCAGTYKRNSPEMDEEPVLMRALRDFNTPKIPSWDTPIFLRLIKDLFPDYADSVPPVIDEALKVLCVQACIDANLQHEDSFVSKVVQFQELLDVRHSVFLLGPTGCAKSTIWKMLLACHNIKAKNEGAKKNVAVCETCNPKAVTGDELYGYMTMSKDWKDGLLSIIMRGMSKNFREQGYYEYQTSKWVILDGDIDAVWIESMNTVMDDNKVLTLVSNERIPLTDAMRMVFEVNSLKNASPATVSRAGILYINESDVGWRPMVDSWLALREEKAEAEIIGQLVTTYIETLFGGMRKMKPVVPVRVITMVSTVLGLLECWLAPLAPEKKTADVLEYFFVFACVWAFGGSFGTDKQNDWRKEFDYFWQGTFNTVKFPKETSVYDVYYDVDAHDWAPWSNMVDDYVPVAIGTNPGESPFMNLVVASADSARMTFIMQSLSSRGRHSLLVGGAGTGKTALVNAMLEKVDDDMLTCNINMSYYTDSAALQVELENPIEKRSGRIYGPPPGKKLMYFVDDLNLPYIEEYGTQNSHSLLTQHLCYSNFYDRDDMSLKKDVVDAQYIAAMNPTSGSFTICERLQRHFAVLCCVMPGTEDLTTIYHSIVKGHLGGFTQPIQDLAPLLVDAAILLHGDVVKKYLPSAVKFTYNWNMRELSNIFQGVCLARAEFYPQPEKMVRLWMHECLRVFQDRMVTETDIERFTELLFEQTKKTFTNLDMEVLAATPNIYTSFATPTSGDPAYLSIKGIEELSNVLESKLGEYNESNTIMELVLFEQAMEHVCRIARIISNPSGNAMLIGVGGSGKQSLSRLASHICGYEVTQLNVTSKFSVEDLKEELRLMYIKAGVKGIPTTFLMTDSQIVNDKFLVYVNGILTSGWIPDLFPAEEMEGIFGGLRNEAKAAAVADTPEAMTAFFISRVRSNLHAVLCFSPVGDLFRVRARRFPGLINCTAIDFFHSWSRDALVNVANRFLGEVDLGEPETKENVAHNMAEVHLSVATTSLDYFKLTRRYNYVTPKSFLELIDFYKLLLSERRTDVGKQIDRLDVGLSTLRKTAADVAELQVDLSHTMEKVEEKKKSTDALLENMGQQRGEAEVQEAAAQIEKDKAEKASAEAQAIEVHAESELAEAKPAMDAAYGAVDCLNKASLGELAGFSKPPGGIEYITGACLILIDGEYKNHKWDRAKKMMKDINKFLIKLKEFDMKDIEEKVIKGLEPLLAKEEFSYEVMLKKSSAAANLCNWVLNVYKFNRIYVKVKPLMDSLEQARATKAGAEGDLAAAMAIVKAVNDKLDELQKTFMEATAEKAKVEAEANACLDRLDLAKRLVGGLASENERWGNEIEKLKINNTRLVGDCLLAGAFVSYIGAFDAAFRQRLVTDVWLPDLVSREIPTSEGIDPLQILTDEGRVAQMQSEGLPADRISTENGVIITQCKRWPLIIDPQVQGIKWLRRRYEGPPDAEPGDGDEDGGDGDDGGDDDALLMPDTDEEDGNGQKEGAESKRQPFTVIQLSFRNWARTMTNAIQMGECVIIENVPQELDPTLDPILGRQIYRKGRNMYIKFGGEEIEYDPKFQLFLLTKLSNPHYKPEIAAQCTLINFVATETGLEEQLLAKMVSKEKPELEQKKAELMATFNQYKIQLLDLENQLLERLANAPEDILSDIPLIEGLEATKAATKVIGEAVVLGKETEIQIDQAREVYRPAASESAMLYFMLTGLNAINHMYQYSLDSFVFFFFKGIRNAKAAEGLERIKTLKASLRYTVFQWVARGLFEKHKLLYLAQLAFSLMRRGELSEEFQPTYFDFLVRAPSKLEEVPDIEGMNWMPAQFWGTLSCLDELEAFNGITRDIQDAPARFEEWYNHVTPEMEKLPLDWSGLDKTPFLKLLVVRCLRPDRLNMATENWVRQSMPDGSTYADSDSTLNAYQILEESLADSAPSVPIYFILSPGADVVGDVDKAADVWNMEKNVSYHNISMGQGQDVVAMSCLEMGHKMGHWVILNNVHLMPEWLIELEKKLDAFNLEGSHERFRVFLSSDPSNAIPIGLLARCIKLTNEPPAGLKANLKRAFTIFSKEQIEETDNKMKGILFGLCTFHSVLMERKRFGSKGYNMMYPFSLGDLRDSSIVLSNYMENAPPKIPWADLKYLFGEITYGGHIVNDFDRLLANTYLDHYMRDELFDEMELYPFAEDEKGVSFKAPSPTSYERYLAHIDNELTQETTIAFGLHPNAEIGFRTENSMALYATLQVLQPRDGGGGEGQSSPQHVAENMLNDIQDRFGEIIFDMEDVEAQLEEKGPYQNVFIQECEWMNALLGEIRRSLTELNLGFAGELTMSDAMDALMNSLFLDRIPDGWNNLAWPSQRSLAPWLANFSQRIVQLQGWVGAPSEIPKVTWLSGLVNPQSFLTAIKQVTAQAIGAELDKLVVQTDVTKMTLDTVEKVPASGALIYGLFLQGASWDSGGSTVVPSQPKEMFVTMPVILCKSVGVDKVETKGIYNCPVYKTETRGPTYIFQAQLKTKNPAARWVLAGVALICDIV